MDLDTGRMTADEMGYAARFAARLTQYWPEGHHEPTRKLFAELAQALTDCQAEQELRGARLDAAHADDWSVRVALGMQDERDPPPIGWTGIEPVPDGTPEPVSDETPEPDDSGRSANSEDP